MTPLSRGAEDSLKEKELFTRLVAGGDALGPWRSCVVRKELPCGLFMPHRGKVGALGNGRREEARPGKRWTS